MQLTQPNKICGSTPIPKWMQSNLDKSPKIASYILEPKKHEGKYMVSINHWGWCEYYKSGNKRNGEAIKYVTPDSTSGENKHAGYLSAAACKKLRKVINYLVYVSNFHIKTEVEKKLSYDFKINFITLTLPSAQVHSDQFIKRNCLSLLLKTLTNHYGMNQYVWKAEAQANGNIHFHITTNTFIPHDELRAIWNGIISKYGYIENYSSNQKAKFANGFVFYKDILWKNKKTGKMETAPRSVQKNRYDKNLKCGWNSPNSTDVHTVKEISNLGGYLASYMSKKDSTRRPITGKLWDSSRNLKKQCVRTEKTAEISDELSDMLTKIAKNVFSDSYVTVCTYVSKFADKLPAIVGKIWGDFLSETFPEIVPSPG